MSRPLTDRERCLQLEARVAELEEELAAYKANERRAVRDAADLSRQVKVRDFFHPAVRKRSIGAVPAAMLLHLLDHPGVVATKEQLYDCRFQPGADPDYEPQMKVVDVHVCHLREALAARGYPRAIDTVWGRGYRIEPAMAATLKAAILGEGAT